MVTDEKYTLKCELAFRSIGYRSVQADPEIPFDKLSSTVPQSTGIVINFNFLTLYNLTYFTFKGVYSVGWLSSGPVGVILSTMSNAFQTATLIGQHFDEGLLGERKPGYDYISKVLKDKGIIILA